MFGSNNKPVVGGRFSLWGEAKIGTMLGVDAMVVQMVKLLLERKITKDASHADGYSLIPVHAWSHNVTGIVSMLNQRCSCACTIRNTYAHIAQLRHRMRGGSVSRQRHDDASGTAWGSDVQSCAALVSY